MKILKNLPEQEILKRLFDYQNGQLIHKTNETNSHINYGYRVTVIDNECYREHRVIWKLLNGYDPYILDHINRNKLDNRIENLREATDSLNVFNVDDSRYENKAGLRCVNKWGNKYRARISFNNKRVHLGLFKTKEEAHNAYLEAARQYYG